MKKNKTVESANQPLTITPEDKIILREMLEFILTGSYFNGMKDELDIMMNSDSRVACLKLIESTITVNNKVDNFQFFEFFKAYIADTTSRMNLKTKITKEFRCFDFNIGKKSAMKLCLIIGELVTNSLKHGIGSKKKLKLCLAMGVNSDEIELFDLMYMDEGLGFTEDRDMRNEDQFGLTIIHEIAKSFETEIKISTFYEGGTGFECSIDANKLQEFYC